MFEGKKRMYNQRSLPWMIAALWVLGWASGCKPAADGAVSATANYNSLNAIADGALQAVIEIPAGTNHKMEYDPQAGAFLNDRLNEQERVIDFLPYPGNYGFIAGTLLDKAQGGDGDPLDVLVIAEAMPTGTVVRVVPIAALLLKDKGELDTKIIAIPADENLQVLKAKNFIDFMLRYDQAKLIIEQWFMAYKGQGAMEFLRWEDDRYAWSEVKKWTLKQE